MKKFIVAVLFIFVPVLTVRAELVATWTFDGSTGLEKTAGTDSTGFWTGLTDGTSKVADSTGTYLTRVYDSDRQSYVWQFTPATKNKGAYIDLGTLPALGNTSGSAEQASDFTISLWVKFDPTKTYSGTATDQEYGNSIIFGDRNYALTSSYNFFKAMSGDVQYWNSKNGGSSAGVSTGLSTSTDAWQYLTVTKSGLTLTTYPEYFINI